MRPKEFLMSQQRVSQKQIAVVIRSYNNKNVIKAIERCVNAGLRNIFVVTPRAFDQGSTKGYLEGMPTVYKQSTTLIEMGPDYHWSTALNAGLQAIADQNLISRIRMEQEIKFVLNLSVEVLFELEDLERMQEAFSDPNVGVVGWNFRGKQAGQEVNLGTSYDKPRNTGMMIRLSVFEEMQMRFDPRCDAMGGMEDFHFLLLMVALTDFSFEHLADVIVHLVVGAHHHQPTKEEREQEAIRKILGSLQKQYAAKVPELWEKIKRAASELYSGHHLPAEK